MKFPQLPPSFDFSRCVSPQELIDPSSLLSPGPSLPLPPYLAVAHLANFTGLQRILPSNIHDWLFRLCILQDVCRVYGESFPYDSVLIPLRVQPSHVLRLLHARFPRAPTMSLPQFTAQASDLFREYIPDPLPPVDPSPIPDN